MPKNDMIIRIAGDGGEGIISCGDFIAAACARAGLEIFTFKTFPAEARGGYAMYQVRACTETLHSQGDTFDIFCALNSEAYEINRTHLLPGNAFVHDADFEPEVPEGVHAYAIPMTKVSKQLGFRKAKNMVALGALSHLLDIPADHLKDVLAKAFKPLGEKIVQTNLDAFDKGVEHAAALKKTDDWRLSKGKKAKDVIMLSGDEAVGLGALIAGLGFYAAYPITPASDIAHYLARHLPKTGGTVIQAEDEIASISQVIGASWAGRKAMTATSGPGLSLMGEMLGFAFMSETPVVVVNVQRGGPSTGLPTKHEQSDLFVAIHGSHGDAPRIVLAAADVGECLHLTVEALNLAETYQCPVILLSDSSLAFCKQAIPRPDPAAFDVKERRRWHGKGKYRRYALTTDGISPVADPGTPDGFHIATGLEHDETGKPSYVPENHEHMSAKRFTKLKSLSQHFPPPEMDGDATEQADVGIICWGSTIGPAREAVARLRAEGMRIKGLYPRLLWPLQAEQIKTFTSTCDRILVPEVNHQGQLARLIRAETGIDPVSFTICGGLPFTPGQITEHIREIA
ncbi:MAG: 2-oxoacid:acceptor oxidoreductase subunit alpha [Mariprofundaceae bacterium]